MAGKHLKGLVGRHIFRGGKCYWGGGGGQPPNGAGWQVKGFIWIFIIFQKLSIAGFLIPVNIPWPPLVATIPFVVNRVVGFLRWPIVLQSPLSFSFVNGFANK